MSILLWVHQDIYSKWKYGLSWRIYLCTKKIFTLTSDVVHDSNKNGKICKFKVKCPKKLCQFTTQLDKMVKHLSKCTQNVIQYQHDDIGCDQTSWDSTSHQLLFLGCINNMKNEMKSLKKVCGFNVLWLLFATGAIRRKNEIRWRKRTYENRGWRPKSEFFKQWCKYHDLIWCVYYFGKGHCL